jgi:hypothetical protein
MPIEGRKKFAQFLRKSACAVPDRAADRRRFANAGMAAGRPLPHLVRALMRSDAVRGAQMLREKNAFI